jgi:predicted nucleic acid-binding protein
MYILDTNVLSELRHGKSQPSPAVRAWAALLPQSRFYLSAITVLEHELGVVRLERRTPPQGSALRAWWDATLKAFADRILPLDAKAARICATLHVPYPKSYRDSMVAATALAHGFAVVTRNVDDYRAIAGLTLVNPWEHDPDAREPTADEAAGMLWWNGLSDAERARWAQRAGTGVVADAWALFKQGGTPE